MKSECEGRTKDVVKETLPAGGAFVRCTGESQMMKGVETTQIAAEVPYKEGSLRCHLETDKSVDTVSRICKSIRKK